MEFLRSFFAKFYTKTENPGSALWVYLFKWQFIHRIKQGGDFPKKPYMKEFLLI